MNDNDFMKKRDEGDSGMVSILLAVSICFLLAIIVSIYSLMMLARENTKEIDTMLTYRIYDSIASRLNEPVFVSKTMSCDDFLIEFLKNEDDLDEDEAVETVQRYLKGIKKELNYDAVFLVSEKSRRYYTYEGLNKIVDPENNDHDVWYSKFLESDLPYDLDVDSDEVAHGRWTVFVNARIEDENGKLLGACGVGVKMTELQDLFHECEKEYGVKINFVDKDGIIQVDTDDINIESPLLDEEVLSRKKTEEYVTHSTYNDEFIVTKYVEHLGWYLVVRSEPTAISMEFFNIILLNVILFLFVMAVLILTVAIIFRKAKIERDDREKLMLVSERAVAASEAKSSFLSSMSHEIRTPINTVIGMNEMILRQSDDEKTLEYSTNIRNAGKTLLSLINSILDFSKIEEGKMEIIPVEYSAASLINDLVAGISERAKEKGLEFIVEADPNIPSKLFGDDVRLSQIIMNILTNAVKYTEKGYVKFIIREEKRDMDDIDLYVEVEDSGIGIHKEDIPKMFESFERLDEVKNRSIEGTGLGMSIVVNLLKLMGSEIKVESEYGKGSKFYFVITQKIMDETPIGDYSTKPVINDEKKDNGLFRAENAKVLVVDDNEMNLKVATNLLGLYGITPEECTSGFDAVKLVRSKHYDLILLDHMMPKMDGKETLAMFKNLNILPGDTHVIALTANAVNGAKEDYLSSGFDDYLSKPIEVKELEAVLRKWIRDDGVVFEFDPDNDEEDIELDNFGDNNKAGGGSALLFAEMLKESGIDTDAGLSYCGGDMDLYKELLSDYVDAFSNNKEELGSYIRNKDWNSFEVKIHAVKSTSKTIGSSSLFEGALSLEEAARELNAEKVTNDYPLFLSQYEEKVRTIKQILEF